MRLRENTYQQQNRERMVIMAKQVKKSTTVPLNWKEVWFTNCPMVSANNVDQELGVVP